MAHSSDANAVLHHLSAIVLNGGGLAVMDRLSRRVEPRLQRDELPDVVQQRSEDRRFGGTCLFGEVGGLETVV